MSKQDNTVYWVAGAILLALGFSSRANAGDLPGVDDPDDDLDPDVIYNAVVTNIPTPTPPTPKNPLGPLDPYIPPPKPPSYIDPGGPTPSQIDDLIRDYPTPASFYQVKSGDTFTGDQGVATRLARSALFLAARDVGGMDTAAANAWAGARDGYQAARLPVTKWIACVPWNDALYGTYALGNQSVAGPHGRGIRMLQTSAPNAQRIRGGEAPIRNIRICAPGDAASCSAVPIDGQYRRLELLWLPEFDLDRLWSSGGTDWTPGGLWGDKTTKLMPPPKIWALGIRDLSNSGLGSWGCAPYSEAVPT